MIIFDCNYKKRTEKRINATNCYSILLICCIYLLSIPLALTNEHKDIFDYSLEELGQVTLSDTFSLTKTTPRSIPAASTIIDRNMIDNSGARNLDELLEIYVPSLLSLHHPILVGRRFATRGIVSNDTVLMLVNNRVMNERMFGGAQSERGLSMLGDIKSIEVTLGPGAALHGAGAMAAIIHIKTYNDSIFKGADASVR